MLVVSSEIIIPDAELEFSYARSSGPGGQNVNKVNSKAILHWSPVESASLPEPVRQRFVTRFGSRLSADGSLVLMSERHRDQGMNRQDCLDKLTAMLREVAVPPRPRRKTKPTRSSARKREETKRHRGETKRTRGRVSYDD